MRNINLIIIHCSATRADRNFSVEDLEACHKARGFRAIGYHYYITRDGLIHLGRPEEMVGAHAKHYNAHSIGICYEGGLNANGKPADTRTAAQKRSMAELLKSLRSDFPDADIVGHRDMPRRSLREALCARGGHHLHHARHHHRPLYSRQQQAFV